MRRSPPSALIAVSLAVAVFVMPKVRAQAPAAGADGTTDILDGAALGIGPEYYVSPTGSDANPCTAALPCRQIRRALHAGRRPATPSWWPTAATWASTWTTSTAPPGAPITIKARGHRAHVVTVTTDRPDNRDTIFITFSSYIVVDGLRSSGANRAAVRVDQSPNVTIRNGVFGNNGTWGIFTDFADDLLLENNECFGSVAEHGIYVSNSGDRPVVRRNRVHDNNASGDPAQRRPQRGRRRHHHGRPHRDTTSSTTTAPAGGAAINLDGVQDSIVRNNLLYNNRATGIVNYQGDGAQGPRGMQILHNTIDMPSNGRWALLIYEHHGPEPRAQQHPLQPALLPRRDHLRQPRRRRRTRTATTTSSTA